jgi:predicted RNase H-like HicB family nuclease
MYKYEVILYWSAGDDAYIAEATELSGCCADGETREIALRNVETVIDEWIETAQSAGREIPKPIGAPAVRLTPLSTTM